MNVNETSNPAHDKNRGWKKHPAARRTGYIFSIIFMIIAIYVLWHLREWGLTFLTDEFERAMYYIQLAIYASIGANFLWIFYDNKWFRHIIQAMVSVVNALSTIMLYVIFPFAIKDQTWVTWLKVGLLVIFCLTLISVLVELIKGIRYLVRDPEAV
jgi:hypothetical protein